MRVHVVSHEINANVHTLAGGKVISIIKLVNSNLLLEISAASRTDGLCRFMQFISHTAA